MSFMTHLLCPKCGLTYNADEVQNLCLCGAPLLVGYDLVRVRDAVRREDLTTRPHSLWRYREVLPLREERNMVSLGESMTPLLRLSHLEQALGFGSLWLKDEGANPTGTFKARGAAVGISRAKELGIRSVAMPTNGNAGGAWSAYAARAGIEMTLIMPTDAPPMAVQEAAATGARSYFVRGQITDAGAIVARSAAKHGWFEASTLKEPYRIEGKKTMGYEIAEQFGWDLPDAILYPTGGGVGLIGIYKALKEMQELGWIGERLPKLIAVQAEGCAPIVRAFHAGLDVSERWESPSTVAQGIRVPKALGDFLVLEAVRATGGTCVAVGDDEIRAALGVIGKQEGLFICPEGAALLPAARKLLAEGVLTRSDRVLLLNTGAGIKYGDLFDANLPVLEIGVEL